ncbi:MAG TPA: TraR/DksA family transcriptional regulator [Chlamydiales bacterium]|nr:TraR/DksA family transcriptional regulator [Chlamydiales bacterium]
MPLKKEEIENFKKTLEQIKAQLTNSIQEATNDVKQPEEARGYSQHQADEGTDDFDKTINLELTNNDLDILKQVERALEKIEEGSYGICDISEEEIPKKRLQAIPYATMTVQAQESLEKDRY